MTPTVNSVVIQTGLIQRNITVEVYDTIRYLLEDRVNRSKE